MFDNINMNLRKNEGFLTPIPCIPIPEYGQSNAPLMYGPEGNRTRGKTKLTSFPRDDHTLSAFVIYLNFSLNNRSKTSGASNNCGIGHFRVYVFLFLKASLSAKFL